MLNQLVLVGRLTKPVTTKELQNGKRLVEIELAVQRNFKNVDGDYDVDIIKTTLWNAIADTTAEYVKVNDLIGIKGRIQSKDGKLEVITEKITFLK